MSHYEQSAANAATSPLRPKKVRPRHLIEMKNTGVPITMLTSYDALTAPIFERAGIDVLLIGDSLGNVMLGHGSTLPVSLEDMVSATAAVARSVTRPLIVADLPFSTYEESPEQAFRSAAQLMKAGAEAVKLEGGVHRAKTIRFLVTNGIPVMGHIGYTPQSIHALGGPRYQGVGDARQKLIEDARAVSEAGAFSVVIELAPADVAQQATRSVSCATIGIGAGPHTDGQVLVWSDMAGMSDWTPSFVRRFTELGTQLQGATEDYIAAVRSRDFPAADNYRER